MPLWKVGAQFVKKQCINDPKKSYFLLCLPVFYEHCPSKPLNAGKQEKPQKLTPVQVKCNFLKANKLNTNPPKATLYCKLQCFLHLRACLKTPQKSANHNLELSRPPQPPPFQQDVASKDLHAILSAN